MKLTEHFALDESVVSQTAARLGIDNTPPPEIVDNLRKTAELLEQVRKALRAPILITSGYRCRELNRAVGGVARFVNGKEILSAHTSGQAADFRCPGAGSPKSVAMMINGTPGIAFDQLIYEFDSWVHIAWATPNRRLQVQTIDRAGARGLTIAGVIGFLWLRLDAVSAERDLAQQEAKIFANANKAWVEREKQREAFQAEVLAGLQRLSGELAVLRTTNESFQRRVNSNANSNRPLDPAERDALKLFVVPGSGGNGAGATRFNLPTHLRQCAQQAGLSNPDNVTTVGQLLIAFGQERTARLELGACHAEIVRLIDVHNAQTKETAK
jgi:zinc D-Ala-D-Ala carboxypeptidase